MNPSVYRNRAQYHQLYTITNTDRKISGPPEIKLDDEDFESGQDSTILVRERAKGTKLEGDFKKRKRVLMEQSNHTITFFPAGRSQATIISKRDVGIGISSHAVPIGLPLEKGQKHNNKHIRGKCHNQKK